MASAADIGIDLGTSNVLIYARGKGIVLNEPAVVALERDTRSIRAIGTEAHRMIGRTHSSIAALRPLREGMVSDFELTSSMLHYFVTQVIGKRMFARPRAVLSLPSGVNEMEKRSISAIMFEAGARRTQLLDRPVAAAIGAGINITDAYGSMIVDIGAGMTDIAVLSLGRVIVSDAAKLGGDHFDDAIIRYLRRKHNLLIGERTAEELKINIGSAMPRAEQMYLDVTGRNLISGLPKLMRITSDEIYEAIDDPLTALIEAIHAVLEHTPAELAADVFDNGIVLSGGGARLSGLADAISTALKVDCRVADNPQECVATGCGLTLENLAEFGRYLNDGRRR